MAGTIHFTKAAISELVQTGKRYYLNDDLIQGLVLCVAVSGRKSFELVRKFRGRARRLTLGVFPAMPVELARRTAQQRLGELAAGVNVFDASAAQTAGEMTLGELHRRYVEEHSRPSKKTCKDDDDIFQRHWKTLRNRPLATVTRADLQARHRAISATSPVSANRAVALIRQMFNWATREGHWSGANPAASVRLNREKSRERFLHPDEMPKFLDAVEQCGSPNVRDYVKLSLMLGARQSNMLAMRWEQLHFERAEWRIPVTKNGEPLTVHLPTAALEVLEARKALVAESPWVFPAKSKCGHLVEPKTAWATILKRAGIENLRLHDLRRTLGSWQAAAGASLPVIGKSLGHKSVQSTAIYARMNLDPVRNSVNEAVAAMLATRDCGPPSESSDLEKQT